MARASLSTTTYCLSLGDELAAQEYDRMFLCDELLRRDCRCAFPQPRFRRITVYHERTHEVWGVQDRI